MNQQRAYAKIIALEGIQPVRKIVDIFLSIDNFKKDTTDKLNRAVPYADDGSRKLIPIDEMYVDLTYQRNKLRLNKIIRHLLCWYCRYPNYE